MQTVEQAYHFAADLYSIAFLLTRRSELSLEVTTETLNCGDDVEAFFSPPARARLRKRVIANALSDVGDELALSAGQTASRHFAAEGLPQLDWTLDLNTSRRDIESALLTIEIFRRCALLLTVFEGFTLEDTSALLSSDPELVLKGRTMALWDLTYLLARMQGWRWKAATAFAPSLAPVSEIDATIE